MADFDLGSLDFGGGFDFGGSSFPSGLSLGGAESAGPSFPSNLNLSPAGGGLSFPDVNLSAPVAESPGLMDIAGKAIGGVKSGAGELGNFAKGVMPFAQLGLGAMGIKGALDAGGAAKEQAKNVHAAQQLQRESTAPLTQFGTQQLQRAEAGQVDPAVSAMIDQWAQSAKIKIQQFFASSGQGNSSALAQELAHIDQMALAMKSGELKSMEQLGVGALEGAAGAATATAGTAGQQQNELEALIKAANMALSGMAGAAA